MNDENKDNKNYDMNKNELTTEEMMILAKLFGSINLLFLCKDTCDENITDESKEKIVKRVGLVGNMLKIVQKSSIFKLDTIFNSIDLTIKNAADTFNINIEDHNDNYFDRTQSD